LFFLKRRNPAGVESRLGDFLLKSIEQQTRTSQQLFWISFFLSYYHDTDKTVLSVEAPEEPVQLNRLSFSAPKAGILFQEKKKS
jgi:hypothetical protein